jgi:hypothetical protein
MIGGVPYGAYTELQARKVATEYSRANPGVPVEYFALRKLAEAPADYADSVAGHGA